MTRSQPVGGHREHAPRLERVLVTVHDHALFAPPKTTPPAPLQWAIAEFRLELRRVRRSVANTDRAAR